MTQVSNESSTQLFDGQPLMAIRRGFDAERSLSIARTAWDLGIDCVELPIQSDRDIDPLHAVVAAGTKRGRSVGAGTMTSLERVHQAAEAGAAFTASPGFDLDVVRASRGGDRTGTSRLRRERTIASGPVTWRPRQHRNSPGSRNEPEAAMNLSAR